MKPGRLFQSDGFTLIELIIAIVIFSIASLMVMAPLLVSSRGIGSQGAARGMQMLSISQEYAETVSSDLTQLSQNDWVATLSSLLASSPATITPDTVLNGKNFRVTELFTCVEKDLKTIDRSCSGGFAKIVVTVTTADSDKAFALTFIKTRTGI